METITLHFNKSVKEKLMAFLGTFSKNDLEIEADNSDLKKIREELQKDYKYSQDENAEFLSVSEARQLLNRKYGE